MKKTLLLSLAVSLVAFSIASGSFAQDRPVESLQGQQLRQNIDTIQDRVQEALPRPVQAQDRTENVRLHVMPGTDSFENIRVQRLEAQEQVRLEIQERTDQVRESQREQIELRQDAFRQRIQQVLDERGAQLAERLMATLNTLNQRLSDRYEGFLNSLEIVLDKVESRTVQVQEAQGIELSSVVGAIESARGDIEIARALISDQKAKVYVVEVGDANTVQQDFRAIMQELRQDHEQLRERVIIPMKGIVGNIFRLLQSELTELQRNEDLEEEIEEEEIEEEEEVEGAEG
jgi:hypothetical protein